MSGHVIVRPTLDATSVRRCSCHALDAYDCWTSRYGVRGRINIEMDGGPCQCVCHDEVEDDEW